MSRVITADAFNALPQLPAESVHAVVCDPPYGLAFMGRDWDDFEPKEYQEWCERWAAECLRVLKPGGHLLSFGGDRTHDLSQSGIRFAGFEIRPFIAWIHGQGFPKALDVPGRIPWPQPNPDAYAFHEGWKTALKPAIEPITVARKPFEGTVAENVQAHGTGALNIGENKIEANDGGWTWGSSTDITGGSYRFGNGTRETDIEGGQDGRYPANVIFDAEAAERLDREVGDLGESKGVRGEGDSDIYGNGDGYHGTFADGEFGQEVGHGDSGGPSRYFYTSKATRAERTLDGKIENAHPTVKPIDLMEWLVRLVTAEGQHVLDPFAGTGTTGRAAKNLGREFTLIERDPKWADVARARCGLTPDDPSRFTPDGQTTLTGD